MMQRPGKERRSVDEIRDEAAAVRSFRERFNAIVVRLSETHMPEQKWGGLTWKEIVNACHQHALVRDCEASVVELYKLRREIVEYINTAYCGGGCTESSGASAFLSSDIDVNMDGVVNPLHALFRIRRFLSQVFETSSHGLHAGEWDRSKVASQVLDVNYYTSTFRVLLEGDRNRLVAHVRRGNAVHSCLSSRANALQRLFALRGWRTMDGAVVKGLLELRAALGRNVDGMFGEHGPSDSPLAVQAAERPKMWAAPRQVSALQRDVWIRATEYGRYVTYSTGLLQELNSGNVSDPARLQALLDTYINAMSAIADMEDDAYTTQGAFLRWVHKVEGLPVHLLVDAAVENLAMARSHASDKASMYKYLARVWHTCEDLARTCGSSSCSPADVMDVSKSLPPAFIAGLGRFLSVKAGKTDSEAEYSALVAALNTHDMFHFEALLASILDFACKTGQDYELERISRKPTTVSGTISFFLKRSKTFTKKDSAAAARLPSPRVRLTHTASLGSIDPAPSGARTVLGKLRSLKSFKSSGPRSR